jgi:hypothetical protein
MAVVAGKKKNGAKIMMVANNINNADVSFAYNKERTK